MSAVNDFESTSMGNISVNPRGEYSEGTEYEYLDMVSFKGGSYICLRCQLYGVAPVQQKTNEDWFCASIAGTQTSEYVATRDEVMNAGEVVESMHKEVLEKAQQVADDTALVEADRAEVSKNTGLAKNYMESASGFAGNASKSALEAKIAEDNAALSVAGFDAHAEEKAKETEASITEARQKAVSTITTQQEISEKKIVDEADKYISEQKELALTSITSEGTKQVDLVQKEGNAKKKEVTDEGEKQVTSVTEAGDAQNKKLTAVVTNFEKNQLDIIYKEKVAKATTKEEVDAIFIEWWELNYVPEEYSKADMLERWFGNVLDDSRIHGATAPLYDTSTSMIAELTDDSAGLVCQTSTASAKGEDPFEHLPQFWCLEVSAEKKADGSHEIFYVEHIDDLSDVRSGEHLCWVLQKNTYVREWIANGYKYTKMRCHQAPGYRRWLEGTDRTGKIHEYMAHPKYPAGMLDGMITTGTNLAPVNRKSYSQGIELWRKRGSQYSGGAGSILKFIERMMLLKYARKGNSGTIDGCNNYSSQYKAAVSESNVERIVLTTAQAATFLEGSTIMLGESGTDRNAASCYSICDGKAIKKIENVEIEGVTYGAIYIDNGGTTFDTVAGSTVISTAPYRSGWNDEVLGNDGSRINPKSGKEPGMIQKVEFMHGAYLILSDELWNWGTDANGDFNFECYKCFDQSKAGSILSENYIKQSDITMIIPKETKNGWYYIGDTAIAEERSILWLENIKAAGSGVGVGAGFSCYPVASGLRAPWVFGDLNHGVNCGVPCRHSYASVGSAVWNGLLGSPGLEG